MVVDDIRELLTTPRPAEAALFLERVDSTLTAGYAHALQLEAERWRLERRIGEVAAELASSSADGHAQELAALVRRLTSANESLAALRTLLSSLRERRAELKTATA